MKQWLGTHLWSSPWLWYAVVLTLTIFGWTKLGEIAFLIFPGLAFLVWAFNKVLFSNKALVVSLFFLVPLSVPMGASAAFSFPSEFLAALLVFGWLLRLLVKGKIDRAFLFHPITLLLAADLIWMLVASFESTMPLVSFKRLIVRLIFVGAFFGLVAQLLKEKKDLIRIFLLYALGLVPVILLALFRHAEYGFSQGSSLYLMQPFYTEHTLYGACLAFILPLLIILLLKPKTFGWKLGSKGYLLLLSLFGVILIGAVFSYSRGAWVSLIPAGMLFVFLRLGIRTRHLLLLFAVIVIGAGLFHEPVLEKMRGVDAVSNQGKIGDHLGSVANISTDASNLERLNRWGSAWRMFLEKPHFGFGPGTYQFKYAPYQQLAELTHISTFDGNKGNAHSEYLGLLSEVGWPGFLILFGLILATIKTGIDVVTKAIDQASRYIALGLFLGLVTFFVHGIFNSFWDADEMAILVYGSMGGLLILDLKRRKEIRKGIEVV